MLIREWMTREVLTITPDSSLFKAAKLMKEHSIRRLPVVDAQMRLVGIITDRDVKAASPSRATSLDMYELMYLLSEIKVRDIMISAPVSIGPDQSVETAAMLMQDHEFGGLPVVDDTNHVVGIITDHDIFKVLVTISGVRHGGLQIAFEVGDAPGTMRPIFDMLREHKARMVSMLTANDDSCSGKHRVYIRIMPLERDAEERLVAGLSAAFTVPYWTRDGLPEGA